MSGSKCFWFLNVLNLERYFSFFFIFFQIPSSSFHPQISKGKLRIINQEGIITNTAENIQTPSTSMPAAHINKSVTSSTCYKMAPCKMMSGEQVSKIKPLKESEI